jgi:two-component system, sensor histidine kinase
LLRFEVWDSGTGIPEDQREKIFNEFYQVQTNKPERHGGLGLGLAIVDRLCRLLDHPIELVSRLGSGSRFSVMVPSAAPQLVVQHAQPIALDQPAGKLVVVIDDDALVIEGMASVLKTWGCQVVAAASDDEAIASLAERPPDLIISDYRLSDEKTGFEAVERLRHAFGAPIPAFLISGDTAPERLREAKASGYYLLHKPVLPMTLRSLVNQLLREGNGNNGRTEESSSSRRATDPEPAADASPTCLPQ